MTTGIEPLSGQTKNTSRPNPWRMIWAIARKDIAESVRNTQLITVGLLPVLIFLLYRLMVSGINNSSILDIAVYDFGNSQLVAVMSQSPELELHIVTSEAALQERINDGEMSGLQIPADFDAQVAAGNEPELTIWLNPRRGMISETERWQRFVETEIHKLGQQTLPAQIEWVELDSSSFSVDTELSSYLLIVVLTMIFFMTGTNLTAMLITEEKEKKMAMMLINSPANPYHIVWGKVLAGTFLIVVVVALVILLNGGLTGNWPLALLYLIITLPISIGIGIFTGSVAQSSKQCNSWLGIGMILFLIPAWFSTLIELPEPFSSIFTVFPSNFLVRGLNDALTNSDVAAANRTNMTVWVAFMIVIVVITTWRIRRNPQSIIN